LINSKEDEMGGACSMGREIKKCMQHFGQPESKRPLRRPRHKWEGNMRMDLGEMGWDDMD
jgi:hypothetical protein